MKAGTLLYSRPGQDAVEVVSLAHGQHVHILTWPEAILFAESILSNAVRCAKLGELGRYIEARKAE